MSRRRRARTVGPWVPALIAVNVVIAASVAWLMWRRAATDVLPVAVQEAEVPRIDWAGRFAADAGDNPVCADCNVVAIALDIFRPDRLTCEGNSANTSPNICAMMDHGVVFDNFIAHAYQTPIAQMAAFTGRYPSRSGFVSFASTLSPDVPTLPEQMQAAGYTTVAMGSSFEVMTDMSAGRSGKRSFTRPGLNPSLSFGRGFDRFVFTGNRNLPSDSIPWIRQHKDERFFLWMILGTLHWPYGARADAADQERFDPPNYQGILKDRLPLGFELLSHISNGRLYDYPGGPSSPLGVDDPAFIRARYDVGLWTVDQFIGEFLDSLSEDVLKKTIIVLYGVHGEDLGEHGYFGHYDIYDTEVKMSMVILNPQHRREGLRISEQIEGVDFAPTVLDLVGLPPLVGIDGQSAVPAMRDGHGNPDRVTFFERIPLWEDIFRHKSNMPAEFVAKVEDILDASILGDRGLRTSRWKLIHRTARAVESQVSWYSYLTGTPLARPEWELYDLAADPFEQRNVIDEHTEEAAALQEKLLSFEASLPPPQGHDVPVDAP